MTTASSKFKRKGASARAITTAGKIDQAKCKREKMEKPAPEPPANNKPKLRSLPPPHEKVVEPPNPKKKPTRPGKPVTTKEKILEARAAARSRGRSKPRAMRRAGKDEKGGGPPKKVKPSGTMAVLMSQKATFKQFSKKVERSAVMSRRTRRAQRWASINSCLVQPMGRIEGDKGFPIMDIPKDLRVKIWRLVVVENEYFIWPNQPTGQEQPDLAMTSKQIRAEVLPIFYGANTFAVELSPIPEAISKKNGKLGLSAVAALEKISKALDTTGMFRVIRNWAFEYAPLSSVLGSADGDGGLVVSIRFSHRIEDEAWSAVVEVHRGATCILPARPEFGMCLVKPTPAWLNDSVLKVLDAAKRSFISGDMVIGLVKAIKARVMELAGHRCEPVVNTVEFTAPAMGLERESVTHDA